MKSPYQRLNQKRASFGGLTRSKFYRECYDVFIGSARFVWSAMRESISLSIACIERHPTVVLSRDALPCSRANRRQCEFRRSSHGTF